MKCGAGLRLAGDRTGKHALRLPSAGAPVPGCVAHPSRRVDILVAGHAATTIAAWYFASFGGNLLAGALGTLWSAMGHAAFFGAMAAVAAGAGTLLRLLDGAVRRAEAGNEPGAKFAVEHARSD